MNHLGPPQSIKPILWNQAGAEMAVDKCCAFVREVTKLRQFVLSASIWPPAMADSASRCDAGDARCLD
jgi:hypothetical protein